jgi:putative MATE family efflux protein
VGQLKVKPAIEESRGPLLDGPIAPTLIRMAVPMAFGMLALVLFNIVDAAFVGRLGAEHLAAMSFTFPVTFLIMSVTIGLGVGTNTAVSRAVGAGDMPLVRRLTTDGLVLVIAQVVVASALGIVTIGPIFELLGASLDTIVLISDYMFPWYLGLPFLVVPMIGSAAIRGTGDMITPALIMAAAGVFNMVLDPFLIFGIGPFPRLELQGAAIATVCSWIVALILVMYFLVGRKRMLSFDRPHVREVLDSWRRIMFVALPAAATNMVLPLAGGALTRLVASYGEEAVAAFGVGTRVDSFATLGLIAVAFATTPFVGQNYGASQVDRIRAALRFGNRFSLLWGAAAALLLAVGAEAIGRVFSSDPTVVLWSVRYLWVIPASYWSIGILFIISAAFNAVNRPLMSSLLVIARLFVFVVPFAFAGSMLFGLWGILIGITIASALSALFSLLMARRVLHDLERDVGRREGQPPSTSKLEYLPG